jgi:hypothetical protein
LAPSLAQSVNKKGKKAAKKGQAQESVKPRILLCTPIPALKSSWNISDSVIVNGVIPMQQEVAKKYGLQVIDLHTLFSDASNLIQPDGIHPNDKGVQRLADIIAEQILQNSAK